MVIKDFERPDLTVNKHVTTGKPQIMLRRINRRQRVEEEVCSFPYREIYTLFM